MSRCALHAHGRNWSFFQLCVWWSLLMEKLYETVSHLPHCFSYLSPLKGLSPSNSFLSKHFIFRQIFFFLFGAV